ncbi:hypothetical protein F4680DRAFT_463449 [Xylaria scruposa]|nr:hypothetical protein F4680DRAFT_463449 [Xylaria scruposa]
MSTPREYLSLGELVENVLGRVPASVIGNDDSGHVRGLANWYRLNHILITDHPFKSRIQAAISDFHKHVYLVLYEWWTASYQEAHLSLAAILDLLKPSNNFEAVLNPCERLGDPWGVVLRHLQLKRWPTCDIVAPAAEIRNRRYHETSGTLFATEFIINCPSRITSKGTFINMGLNARHESLQWAYCQKMAWKVYAAHKGPVDGTPSDDDGFQKACSASIFTDIEAQLSGNSHDSFLSRGPVLDPCYWLETSTQQGLDNFPYFLFDTIDQCTVRTVDIGIRPEYTVISHTWGRWVKDQPVEVTGVPWKVPQNDLFNVKNLPRHLARIPTETRYVWIDLFCIPQDGSIRGAQEVARQAAIFKNAKSAIAWFSDVWTFDALQRLVKWQLLHLLSYSIKEPTACQNMIGRIFRSLAWKQTGLLKPRHGKTSVENIQLNAWFTSLWTLQEAVMRPDLWLCASDWSYATCDGVTPLPLIGLISISKTFAETHDIAYDLEAYEILFELDTWRLKSGLGQLVDLAPISLIALGDRRECKERRAEAIMSALGATKWYIESFNTIQPGRESTFRSSLEQDLVLGKYPLRFVQELCRQNPGEFFSALIKHDIK